MLARFTGQTPHQLGQLVRRLILTVDLDAAKRRQDLADLKRGVRVWDDVDGQACLQLKGPKPDIAKALAQLRKDLAALPADPADERSSDAKMFDLAIALLTGEQTASGGWEAHIVVPFSTAEGGGLELAEIPGLGPVLPGTAKTWPSRPPACAASPSTNTAR